MELVCHKCEMKITSDMFYQHLSCKHASVRDKHDVQSFVRDHVTFEEALDLDFDEDCTTHKPSSEASVAIQRLDRQPCSTTFTGSSRLLHHLSKHEATLDSVPCCGPSTNQTELIKCMGKEHPPEPLQRKSSDRVAAGDASPSAHIAHCQATSGESLSQVKYETNQKRIPAVCPDCNRTYSNKYAMLKHMKNFCGETREKFDCDCGKSYTSRGNMVAHIRKVHLGLPSRYVCKQCGAIYLSRTTRDVHRRKHSGVRPFSCPSCPRSFYTKVSLKRHQQAHATRHECELCGEGFRRRAHLKLHVGTHRDDGDPNDNNHLFRRMTSKNAIKSTFLDDPHAPMVQIKVEPL